MTKTNVTVLINGKTIPYSVNLEDRSYSVEEFLEASQYPYGQKPRLITMIRGKRVALNGREIEANQLNNYPVEGEEVFISILEGGVMGGTRGVFAGLEMK
ncbi:MAG: hypothetical protein ACW98K_12595 [Candidatus Kariarchaeaceae archaeon]|jgi:hypothetical protein